jgi:thiamine-monophosphate kinase
MKLSQLGEFGLIERVRRATPKGRGVLLGIGDDAAWVATRSKSLLITSDLLIEGIHFNLKWTSLFALGYKTLAVNLSDIAAMGGTPAYLILSLGIPAKFKSEHVDEFYRGIRNLAVKSRVALVGGDTNLAHSLLISACVVGHAPYPPITRSGAKVGHDVYITGTLGDSALGLKFLKSKSFTPKRRHLAHLLSRHHQPIPRLSAGALLARERLATAMIDVSDGLLQDLGHICKASGIGAVIWEERLPISPAYRALCGKEGMAYALTGGEDYELLFCARPGDRVRIENLQKRAGVAVTRIGRCVSPAEGITVVAGAGLQRTIRRTGHDHFKKR